LTACSILLVVPVVPPPNPARSAIVANTFEVEGELANRAAKYWLLGKFLLILVIAYYFTTVSKKEPVAVAFVNVNAGNL
jgi:hypothetical protein